MIRDKNKIYGEANDEATVTAPAPLLPGKLVVGDGGHRIKTFNPGPKRLIVSKTISSFSNADSVSYNEPNKLVGTDGSGNLVLFNRTPPTPPAGRVLVAEVYGHTSPAGVLQQTTITLTGGFFYEVEVIGAGGGGGGGIRAHADDYRMLSGFRGGRGGYYKGIFALGTTTTATLQAGNSGGRADSLTYTMSGSLVVLGSNRGGDGGRSPVLFSGTGNNGKNAKDYFFDYSTNLIYGGEGINGGANGGNTRAEPKTYSLAEGVGASGGGANGPFGGPGGFSIVYNTSLSYLSSSGGGGGAGGGFGLAGNGGGNGDNTIKGGQGYGGGGGGTGLGYGNNHYNYSGGGGGGGGGSRFNCGDFQVLAGGGGGGAGAGAGVTTVLPDGTGSNGANNMDYNLGGGAQGGTGGTGAFMTPIPAGQTRDTRGANGQRGIVRIWRCV